MHASSEVTVSVLRSYSPQAYDLLFLLGCTSIGLSTNRLHRIYKYQKISTNKLDLAINVLNQFNLIENSDTDKILLSPFMINFT